MPFLFAKVKDSSIFNVSFLSFTLLWSKTYTSNSTHHSPLVAFLFPTCQNAFLTASLMASSSYGEEPLTSAQIWLVAKIRPVRRTPILFTITLAGSRELAGLHLCVSVSTKGRHGRNHSVEHVLVFTFNSCATKRLTKDRCCQKKRQQTFVCSFSTDYPTANCNLIQVTGVCKSICFKYLIVINMTTGSQLLLEIRWITLIKTK